jgi:NAD(P)-dependent dehydrogenase (short-subunit alcohol dehydrogenase family)
VRLANKAAIIAGGARGMGGAIALRFADEGCSAVIADVLDAEGEKTAEAIRKKGRDAIFVHCDVSDSRQVRDMVSKAISKFSKIDIMVDSAGIGAPPTSLEDISDEDWDRVVDVNMKGTFLLSQAIAPHMKENNSGNIINIVSVAATMSSAGAIHYAASKAGAWSVSRCIASALASYNIRVNAILPGVISTDMSAVFAGHDITDVDAFYAQVAKSVPLGRIGTTADIAALALFLASDESSYIAGESISINGGGARPG